MTTIDISNAVPGVVVDSTERNGKVYLSIRIRLRPWAKRAFRVCRLLPRPLSTLALAASWPAIKRWGHEVTVK